MNARLCARVSEFLRQGGEIGRRARLRIAKSSISKHRSPFQIKRVLREENGIFRDVVAIRE
jgi:hypothetical protein